MTKDDLISKDIALKMAIEQLWLCSMLMNLDHSDYLYEDVIKAHDACKEALAQPAQSKYVVNSGGTGTELRQPAVEQGEPVAEFKTYTGDGGICAPFNRFEFKPDFVNNAKIGTKLYDKPQPREWVGLSDLDIADAYYKAMNQELRPSDKVGVYKVAKALEAKCKQLNTKG